MILCICPSPALDVTYHLDRLVPGGTNRVRTVSHRPGGKALNVARVLHALGTDVRVLAPVGGTTGEQLAADLAAAGVAADLVTDGAETRRTIAVVDDDAGEATMLNEPAVLSDWATFHSRAAESIELADVVVVSGSLPHGAPEDAFAELVVLAHDARRPVVVDTSGPALLAALYARPTVVKPNADELAGVAPGQKPPAAALALAQRFGTRVVASLGADGLIAAEAGRLWQARPAARLQGNPTGAGDAAVAALALGLREDWPPAETLRAAVALSAAAVLQPRAGEVDPADYAAQRDGIVVREIERGTA